MALVCQTEPSLQLPVALDWLAEAESIAVEFRRHAHKAEDGSVRWLKAARSEDDAGQPRFLGPHLHAGYTGAALFLAAMVHVTEDDEYRDLAMGTLLPLRRLLAHLVENPQKATKIKFRVGAIVGLASFVYTFARVAGWLGEEGLWEDAFNAVTLTTPERIAEDRQLDLMYGSAGAILGLLLFDREAPEPWKQKASALERAVACGEHLLRNRQAEPGEPRGWPTEMQAAGAGFAHGAAGISYALAKLALRTGRQDFWEAAVEGCDYERLHYSAELGDWVILRSTGRALNAWCNGAAGIALSRLGITGSEKLPQLEKDLELALAKASDPETTEVDYVCCGNLGRVDILLQGWRKLKREELRVAAYELAAKVVQDAQARPQWYLCEFSDRERLNAGFYKGMSGVGYALLRLARPADLPCILAVE